MGLLGLGQSVLVNACTDSVRRVIDSADCSGDSGVAAAQYGNV